MNDIIQDKKNYDDIISIMAEFRILLRSKFYTDNIIDTIINRLNQIFDTFGITYNKEEYIIQLKIKKTSIKKNINDDILSFYYNKTIDLFKDIFMQNYSNICNIIESCQTYEYDKKMYLLNNVSMLSSIFCQLLYKIGVISNNIINIYL